MINGFTIVLLVLSVAYIAYIVAEHFYCKSKRKKFELVIHVNGIRGKSTVTRLIDAGLRECGYKVFSKTTGTVPTIIGVDNVPKPIRRLGPANIREQCKMLGRAAKQNANALVLECMAVKPELQYLSENRIIHANLNVITNVRADHLDEMGEDLESIAYSLANTTPKNGVVVLGENKYVNCFTECAEKCGSKVVVAEEYKGDELLDTFPENIAVALQVCRSLNLDEEKFFAGMKKYVHDVGALITFTLNGMTFVNAFSVNDPDSTLEVYEKVTAKYPPEDITVLLNTRPDRPFRINQHIEMLRNMQFNNLFITGSNSSYILKQLKKAGIEAQKIKKPQELLGEKVVFGCGNIAGNGIKILNYFKTNGKEESL